MASESLHSQCSDCSKSYCGSHRRVGRSREVDHNFLGEYKHEGDQIVGLCSLEMVKTDFGSQRTK